MATKKGKTSDKQDSKQPDPEQHLEGQDHIVPDDGDNTTAQRKEGKGDPVKGIEGGYMGGYSQGDYSRGKNS